MRVLSLVAIVVFLFFGISSCGTAQDQSETKTIEKSEKKVDKPARKKPAMIEAAGSEDATLKIVGVSDNMLGIELINSVPIRGMQFTLEGALMNEIRATARSKGFLVDFNKEAGKVVILSTSDIKIDPGSGLIAEVACDTIDAASLSGVKIVK